MKVLVFASGRGSNFEAILNAEKQGVAPIKTVGLLCDRECNAINLSLIHI